MTLSRTTPCSAPTAATAGDGDEPDEPVTEDCMTSPIRATKAVTITDPNYRAMGMRQLDTWNTTLGASCASAIVLHGLEQQEDEISEDHRATKPNTMCDTEHTVLLFHMHTHHVTQAIRAHEHVYHALLRLQEGGGQHEVVAALQKLGILQPGPSYQFAQDGREAWRALLGYMSTTTKIISTHYSSVVGLTHYLKIQRSLPREGYNMIVAVSDMSAHIIQEAARLFTKFEITAQAIVDLTDDTQFERLTAMMDKKVNDMARQHEAQLQAIKTEQHKQFTSFNDQMQDNIGDAKTSVTHQVEAVRKEAFCNKTGFRDIIDRIVPLLAPSSLSMGCSRVIRSWKRWATSWAWYNVAPSRPSTLASIAA